ncbi:MAG: PH domain-containing protein [Cytophagales bacterium]|nr:MAG: PH domain-containing protein [Cytophagales bacterium]
MGYVDKHLMNGENIIYQTKLNWTEYIKGLLVLGLGLIFMSGSGTFGGFLIFVGLIILGLTYLRISTSEFAVTDKRVLIKVGIIKTQSLETMLNKVEGIQVEQGIIGKMVNSGSIVVKGTGGTNNPFSNIDKPFEFRSAVNEQISKI